MPRYWWAVITLGLSIFMATLDTTIVALALPTIARNFHMSAESMVAVTLAYTLTLTVLLIPAGLVSSRFRPQTTFIVGILGFGFASLLCSLSNSLLTLVAARIMQGVFGALITTLGVALIGAIVPPTVRGRALSITGMLGPLGLVTGPALGGLLIGRFGWSSIFYVNVPVSILAAAMALWSLKGASFGDARRRPVFQQIATILKIPSFSLAVSCLFCMSIVLGALFFLLPFDLSLIQHLSPSLAGATLLFQPLGLVFISPLSGYLTDRFGAKPLLLSGISLAIVGLILYTMVVGTPTSVLNLDWRFLLAGLGFGMFAGPVQVLIISSVPRPTLGSASALIGLARNLGTAAGPFIISFIWSFTVDLGTQMVSGVIVVILITLFALGFAYLATRKNIQTLDQPVASPVTR